MLHIESICGLKLLTQTAIRTIICKMKHIAIFHSGNNIKNHKSDLFLKKVYFCAAFMVFLGGFFIYVFFREVNSILLFHFFPIYSSLGTLYIPVNGDSIWMPIFLYNLPDGLWFMSGLLAIRAVWLTNYKWRAIYCGIYLIIALFMELIQLFNDIPGTFDVLDLIFMAVFYLAESVISNMLTKRSIFDE